MAINIYLLQEKYPRMFWKKRKYCLPGIDCDNPPQIRDVLDHYKHKLTEFMQTKSGLDDITSVIADNLAKSSSEDEKERLIERFIAVKRYTAKYIREFCSEAPGLHALLIKNRHTAVRLLCLKNRQILKNVKQYLIVLNSIVKNEHDLNAFLSMLVVVSHHKHNMFLFFFSALPDIHIKNKGPSSAGLFKFIEEFAGKIRLDSYYNSVTGSPDTCVKLGKEIWRQYKGHMELIQDKLSKRLFWITELSHYYSIALLSLYYIKSDNDAEKAYNTCKKLYNEENGFEEHGQSMAAALNYIMPLVKNMDDFAAVCTALPRIMTSLIESKARAGVMTVYSYYWDVLKEKVMKASGVKSFLAMF